jgi:hypothetical protein
VVVSVVKLNYNIAAISLERSILLPHRRRRPAGYETDYSRKGDYCERSEAISGRRCPPRPNCFVACGPRNHGHGSTALREHHDDYNENQQQRLADNLSDRHALPRREGQSEPRANSDATLLRILLIAMHGQSFAICAAISRHGHLGPSSRKICQIESKAIRINK